MPTNHEFATTHWSVVRQAGAADSNLAKAALQELCQNYWYPLYSFVRFRGYDATEAEDLTQSFFADLLKRQDLRKVHPERGRFRSFLLASLNHFLLNEWDRGQTQKRGGGRVHFSMDFADAASRYQGETADGQTPESIFERQWALTLLERVNRLLSREYEKRGKAHVFRRLAEFLAGRNRDSTMAGAAAELGMTEVAVKVAVHRMRTRFGQILRQQIRCTVDSEQDVEDEIARLFEALKR